ncbi:hypothetical protein DEU56DRAFT_928650 [Suillus clintonianus]|uniref:uncharacterized protein n=1 Tax=Suillus clintonianus TaxID=1904413 RepID=UPI001B864082|nr:uncharacterized protein DEU56DRAFT_928650 [Suillus clintonianus]KAG2120019.1 hypothetical protein DEU56DRAFT_928650 [Suillus clintonianus]
MPLSHAFTTLMAFVVIAAAYPTPSLMRSFSRREALASNLHGYHNARDFGSPSPGPANLTLIPLMQPNTESDALGGVDKRRELNSNGPTSTTPDGPNTRSFSPPSTPDEPDSPNSLNFSHLKGLTLGPSVPPSAPDEPDDDPPCCNGEREQLTYELRMLLQEEIDRVIGPDRLPTYEDRASLPYIEALICESLR